MFYYIDFSSWRIKADSEEDAVKKAREIMERVANDGMYPCISSVEEDEEGDGIDEDFVEVE